MKPCRRSFAAKSRSLLREPACGQSTPRTMSECRVCNLFAEMESLRCFLIRRGERRRTKILIDMFNWRRRQSSANLSPPMNSLLQGKIQGILAVLSRIGRSCCRYASIFASDLDQIPYVQEQGIFATKHGTSTREQGGDSAAAGNESDLAPQVIALTCSFRNGSRQSSRHSH